jgi:Flp pilus assembly protein TadG
LTSASLHLARRGGPPRRGGGQHGQNLVEFALVGPLFLVLILGILEGALYVNARITLDNAAREGARLAAICGDSTTYNGFQSCSDAGAAAVKSNLGILDPKQLGSLTVACSPVAASDCSFQNVQITSTPAGQTVDVSLSYTYNFYLGPFVGAAAPQATMTAHARAISQQ